MRYLPYLFGIVLAGLGYWVGKAHTEDAYQADNTAGWVISNGLEV